MVSERMESGKPSTKMAQETKPNVAGNTPAEATSNTRLIRSFTLFDNRDFLPRPFQIELYEACKNRDSIVFLRPGNGKHFIAVMLVKYFTPKRRLLLSSEGGDAVPSNLRDPSRPAHKLNEFNSKRKIFFLTKSLNSIRQYAAVFFAHTDLKIGEYFTKSLSGCSANLSTEQHWHRQLAQYDIHLMLDSMFDELIDQRFVGPDQISLLVLDDVHKILLSPGESCYSRIIRKLTESLSVAGGKKQFRILGLSASILIEDVSSRIFESMIEQIETALDCVCETYADLRMINKYSIQSRIRLRYYPPFFAATAGDNFRQEQNFSFKLSLFQARNYAAQFFEFLSNLYDPKLSEQDHLVTNEMLKRSVVEVLLVYGTMGEWCALQLIQLLCREIADTISLFKATSSNYLKLLNSAYSTLQLIRQSILSYLPGPLRSKLTQHQSQEKVGLNCNSASLAGQNRLSMTEFLQLSSPKLHLLATTLRAYLCELFEASVGSGPGASQPSHSSLTFPSNICSIVYAENRSTVRVLSLWISELSSISSAECALSASSLAEMSQQSPLSYLQPDYVFLRDDCGSLDSRHFYYEKQQKSLHEIFYYRRQEEVLKRFRFGHNCNLLVTSSMAADGLDINRCNSVICFDPPRTFHKFIQSKGRLRVENGLFVVLVEAEQQSSGQSDDPSPYVAKFRQFCEIEKIFTKLVPLNNKLDIESGFSTDKFARFHSATLTSQRPQSNVTPSIPTLTTTATETSVTSETQSSPSVVTAAVPQALAVQLTQENAISILNRYCLKLPSDTFTKLAPHFYIDKLLDQADDPLQSCPSAPVPSMSPWQYQCRLYLPINSTYRDEIVGELCANRLQAKRSAALKAVRTLREMGELDGNYYPVGKETNRYIETLGLQECFVSSSAGTVSTQSHHNTNNRGHRQQHVVDRRNSSHPASSSSVNNRYNRLQARNIASKRRQYYNKKVADCLRGQCFKPILLPDQLRIEFLYELKMKLTCPLPDEQNTRGRRIVDPADTERTFGIIVPHYLPPMCNFTIYNRSGEVTVSVHCLLSANSGQGLVISGRQRTQLEHFHRFTFENVLRLGAKSSVQFDCEQSANGNLLVVPIMAGQIDWKFVELIETESPQFRPDCPSASSKDEPESVHKGQSSFVFKRDLYQDAVIMPKYRRDKLQTFFYVAEICGNLSPLSRFPDNGFETFEEYYRKKYQLAITNLEQPLLDVDHTSSRLNLLTPRYLTRKGQALPATTAETKRTKRSNLQQKQILVPELCVIHPFPGSFWRKAVCLPCMLYRLNSLLVAEEIRFKVAKEANIGCTDLPQGVNWPPLDFGWPCNQSEQSPVHSTIRSSLDTQTTQVKPTTASKPAIMSSVLPKQKPKSEVPKTSDKSVAKSQPANSCANSHGSQDPFQSMGDWTSFADQIGPLEPLPSLPENPRLIPEIPLPPPEIPLIEIISGPQGPTSLAASMDVDDHLNDQDLFDDVLIDDLEMLDFDLSNGPRNDLENLPSLNEPSYVVEIDEQGNEIRNDFGCYDDQDEDAADEEVFRIGSPTYFTDSDNSGDDDELEADESQSAFLDRMCNYWSNFNWTAKYDRSQSASSEESCFDITSESTRPYTNQKDKIDEGNSLPNDSGDQPGTSAQTQFSTDTEPQAGPKFLLKIDELSKDLTCCFEKSDISGMMDEFYYFYENSEEDEEGDRDEQTDGQVPKATPGEYEDNGSYSDFDYDEEDDEEEEEELMEEDDFEDEDNFDEFEDDDDEDDQEAQFSDDDHHHRASGRRPLKARRSKKCTARTVRTDLNESDFTKTKSFIYDILRYEMLYDCNQFEELQGPFQDYYRQKLGQEELEKRNSRKLFEEIYRREKGLIRRCANAIQAKQSAEEDMPNDSISKENTNSEQLAVFEPERSLDEFDSCVADFSVNNSRPLLDILLEKFNDDPEQLRQEVRNGGNSLDEEEEDEAAEKMEDEEEEYSLEAVQPSDSAQSTSEQSFYSLIQRSSDDIKFGELLPNRDEEQTLSCSDPCATEVCRLGTGQLFSFDQNVRKVADGTLLGPDPSLILQAITMSNSSDGINLERLETVGDSFLKYSITAFLFCMCPDLNEGKLSFLRSRQISNINLHRLGQRINLGQMMNASKFEPNDNWCPPGYKVVDDAKASGSSATDKSSKIPYNLLTQHSIPNKSIADCVEALIGTYLISAGSQGAIQFMDWLGLKVLPRDLKLVTRDGQYEQLNTNHCDSKWLPIPKSPVIIPKAASVQSECDPDSTVVPFSGLDLDTKLNQFYESHRLNLFEQSLGYRFRDKAYLVQAFTHNSFYENTLTDCYQRLEFLGDAVLDYLITRYLYEDSRCHSPGTLTDLRSALVNNTFFASLAVKYNFHKYLMMLSFELYRVIDGFVRKFNLYNQADYRAKHRQEPDLDSDELDKDGVRSCSYWELFISENEAEHLEDIEVPKALGDIFESVAGAIFLDSGMSLDAVWRVYYPMMKPEIEYFSYNVPKSPIRVLLEKQPQTAKFGKPEITSGRKIRVCVEVFDVGKFVGVGRNKRIAKCTAAKRALRALKLIEENKQRRLAERLRDEQQYQFAGEMVANECDVINRD